jgi:hypothetical protein
MAKMSDDFSLAAAVFPDHGTGGSETRVGRRAKAAPLTGWQPFSARFANGGEGAPRVEGAGKPWAGAVRQAVTPVGGIFLAAGLELTVISGSVLLEAARFDRCGVVAELDWVA